MDKLTIARACADQMYANDKASKALGIEIEIPEPGAAVATMRVREDMLNGFEICHGGLVFTLAGSGTIEYLRPVFADDELRAVALEEHRGKRGGLYAVEVVNQHGDFVALFRGRSVSREQRLLEG